MRIQHNIMAMNAYRNFSNNTSALSKNLEKLSSGYKINRAGDDAAGLAISEKMRAQISGLEQAQKNAKSGINLVQTAEGALTEVHDMLNRMVTLSEQSANGTYDDVTDRANLQKEFDQLRTEIDRIADSSNFNGINLLDGSLSSGSVTSQNKLVLNDLMKDALATSSGVAGAKTATMDPGAVDATGMTNGYEATYTFTFDKDGVEETHTVKITLAKDGASAMVSVDGATATQDDKAGTSSNGALANGGKLAAGDTAKILKGALEGADWAKDLDFTIAPDSVTGLTFTANEVGTDRPTLKSVSYSRGETGTALTEGSAAVSESTKALDKVPQLNLDSLRIANAEAKATAASKVFEINGRKFAILDSNNTTSKADLGLADDVVTIKLTTGNGGSNADAADAKAVMEEINKIVGSEVFSMQQATDTKLTYNGSITKENEGQGLTLQIGDTSDSFNQLTVSVGDMHAKALGIGSISIADQASAQAAVQSIKTAINSVSSTRGDLGALQNRLDHTINNLSVMQENIQDAESTIRDTDVADEMMAYTKNNILVQSAQAMLAQANQVPQGVLQLLQ